MTEDEVIRRARIIATDPGFYVEARVGRENHRGQCCRAVYENAHFNDRADDLIRLFAERIASDNPPSAGWSTTPPSQPGFFWWRNTEFKAHRHPMQFVVWNDTPATSRLMCMFGAGLVDPAAVPGEWGPRIDEPGD